LRLCPTAASYLKHKGAPLNTCDGRAINTISSAPLARIASPSLATMALLLWVLAALPLALLVRVHSDVTRSQASYGTPSYLSTAWPSTTSYFTTATGSSGATNLLWQGSTVVSLDHPQPNDWTTLLGSASSLRQIQYDVLDASPADQVVLRHRCYLSHDFRQWYPYPFPYFLPI